MTAKEYLKQAYRLDKIIRSMIQEVEELKSLATSIRSPQYGEKVQTTINQDAPYQKTLEKVWQFEQKMDEQICLWVALKEQIAEVISGVKNPNEQLVLRHRYILEQTWEEISEQLMADPVTIYRWHLKALKNVQLPENIISIKRCNEMQ